MKNLFKKNVVLLVLFLFVVVPRLIVFIFQDRSFTVYNDVLINVIVALSIISGIYTIIGGMYGFRYKVARDKIASITFILAGLGLLVYSLYRLLVFTLWSNYTGI